jgi:cyclopropane fatty-acyl-phospholipid synthase-like methyltransferase
MSHIPSGEDKISKVASITLKFLQKILSKSERYSFLDIGCGNGRDIAYFSSQLDNIIMYGIDISQKAIEDAIQLNSNKPNIKFECKNWIELDDTSYDIIYSSGVYHFFKLTEREAFISKIMRILNPHGLFFLSTLSSNDSQYYGKGIPVKNDPNSFQSDYYLHFSSEEELQDDFGFLNIIELYEYFHKNYAKDTEYHTMWMLVGEKAKL